MAFVSCALTTYPKGRQQISKSLGQLNRQGLKESIIQHHYSNNYKSSCSLRALSHLLYLSLKLLGVSGSGISILAHFLYLFASFFLLATFLFLASKRPSITVITLNFYITFLALAFCLQRRLFSALVSFSCYLRDINA